MRLPHVDDRVRLLEGVPNTALSPGQVGIICSTWSGCSEPVFEVEFDDEASGVRRQLLTLTQIVIEEDVIDLPLKRG